MMNFSETDLQIFILSMLGTSVVAALVVVGTLWWEEHKTLREIARCERGCDELFRD